MTQTPEPTPAAPQPVTFTDRLRKLTHAVLHPLGLFFHRLGVHPDHVTIAGTVLVVAAAVLIAFGQLTGGALLLLLALPFDALDGAIARAMQRKGKFGALLDSSLDRYADAVIFAGLGYHFAVQGRLELLALSFAALIGSYGVSYVRARAEGLGVDVKIGLFSRIERILVILVMLLLPDVPAVMPIGLIVLAIGTNLTTFQRLSYVYRVLKQREG
jgi:CDP-diacylglycerol--glycerol-3-phosphate 3-phosphatidyltransferase